MSSKHSEMDSCSSPSAQTLSDQQCGHRLVQLVSKLQLEIFFLRSFHAFSSPNKCGSVSPPLGLLPVMDPVDALGHRMISGVLFAAGEVHTSLKAPIGEEKER